MLNEIIPIELENILSGEKADFTIKASRAFPLKTAISGILFGLFWLGFTSIFFVGFLGPVIMGKEVHFKANGVPVVAGPGNLGPLAGPAVFIGVFVLIGIGIFGYGIYALLAEGPWFCGTAKRMVIYKKNNLRSIDWEQFTGDIEVNGASEKADIILRMRTGRMVSRKNGPDRYVPDTINIAGIRNAFEIEKICRMRIKENDPTPPASGG